MEKRLASIVSISLLLLISGCATLPRNPVPLDQLYTAEVVGAPGVRAWGGLHSPLFQADIIESVRQETEDAFIDPATGKRSYAALAISGGGSDGAFGAGFLYGWSSRGDRPVFKLVTGISTGALIAPFAFLGAAYDEELKQVYTGVSTTSIVDRLNIFRILTESESFTTTAPLQNLISEHIDQELLQRVAMAHDQGRRLYIGTTHMDAQRLVIWNMGLIAQLNTQESLELFRKVLLASASIPSAMPPVLIQVEAGGQIYDEMHADGGTATQVFFHAGTINLSAAGKETGIAIDDTSYAKLYILRNGKISPEPQQVPRNLPDISARALDTMIKTAALNNLFRMYVFSQKERSEIHYAGIPGDYDSEAKELFDKKEMNQLFQVGFAQATSAEPWQKEQPGLDEKPQD